MVGNTKNHKVLGMLFVSTLFFSLVPVYAQVQVPLGGYSGSGYGGLSPMSGPLPAFVNMTKGCSYEEYENTRMFIPVTVGIQYPPTSDVVINRTASEGTQITNTETTSPTMNTINIYTNNTDTLTYHVELHWKEILQAPRIVTVELLSMGEIVVQERVPVGNDFCKDIRITTSIKPHEKTVEEIVGAAGVEAINNMQQIVPALNQNTEVNYNGQLIQIGEGALIALGFSAFVFQRFYGAKTRRDAAKQLHETIEKVRKMAINESIMLKNNALLRLEQEKWMHDLQKNLEKRLITLMHTIGFDASLVIKSFNDAMAEFASKNGILFKKFDSVPSDKVLIDVQNLTDEISLVTNSDEVKIIGDEKEKTLREKISNIPGKLLQKEVQEELPAENSKEHFMRIHEKKTVDELYGIFHPIYEQYTKDIGNVILKNEIDAITELITEKSK